METTTASPGDSRSVRRKTRSTFFLKLHEDPLIYVLASGRALNSGLRHCLKDAAGRRFHILVVPYWAVPDIADALETFAETAETLHPKMRVHFMCPDETATRQLLSRGLSAIHVHQNAFIDDRIFRPRPEVPKRFAAIHNAAMTEWKRHHLAWDVQDICVVTYRNSPESDPRFVRGYRHLAWSNLAADGTVAYLNAESVASLVCAARVGLILSGKEGGNFASGEYQFCGVPVVSTPSEGGRTAFLDQQSTLLVKPEAHDVLRAVASANANPLDPQQIRARVMNKAIAHRVRLLDWMSGLAGQSLHAKADARAWLPSFRDKLRERVPLLPP
jgi:glycosyltransferase involved in cell wall biosynthesis